MTVASPGGFVRHLFFFLGGPLIWFAHFSLIYGAVGFGGALGFAPPAMRLFAWSATFAAIAVLLAMLWQTRASRLTLARNELRPTFGMARPLAALALVAVLLEALVLWIVPL